MDDLYRFDLPTELKNGKARIVNNHRKSGYAKPRSKCQGRDETSPTFAWAIAFGRGNEPVPDHDQNREGCLNPEEGMDVYIHGKSIYVERKRLMLT
jgi:hypothetical protein